MVLTDNLQLAGLIGKLSTTPLEIAQAIRSRVKRERELKNIDMGKHWDMYQGNHSKYFKQRKNEDIELLNYRKSNAVISNYVRYIVDLSGKYLYGRASKVSRKFSNESNTDERMRKLIKQTHYDTLLLNAAKRAGIFGEIGVRLIPIDFKTGEQPVGGVATESTYPHPILLDPSKTFFLLNKWQKIVAVVIEDEYTDFAKAQKHKTLELIVEDSRWFWDDIGAVGSSNLTGFDAALPSVVGTLKSKAEKNLYSLSDEFVLALNNDSWIDDVQDMLGLNIQMDEVLTDNAHFFSRHGWPQLVSSVDLKNVQMSPQHVWNVQSDGPNDDIEKKLFFLQWDGRMQEAHTFVQYLEALIFKVSNTARIATGDLEAIGQLRSGPAIVTAHSPSIQKTQEKQVTWCNNEVTLLNAIASFDAKIHGQSVESRYKGLDIYITFPRDFVPGEELVRAQIMQIYANSTIKTFKDLIRENHPEFSEAEVEEYRKELIKDSTELIDSARQFVTTGPGAKGTQPSGASGSSKEKSVQQGSGQTKSN